MPDNVDIEQELLSQCRGCLVAADCGQDGYYQGLLKNIKSLQGLELEKPLKDGIPLDVPYISLMADKIKDVKVVKLCSPQNTSTSSEKQSTSKKMAEPTVTVDKKPNKNPETQRYSSFSPARFSIQTVPVSVLSGKNSKAVLAKVAATGKSAPKNNNASKKMGVEGTRITVKELLG